jgi:hypothetical protein
VDSGRIRARALKRGSAGARRSSGYKPVLVSVARAAGGSRSRWWLEVISPPLLWIVPVASSLLRSMGVSYPRGRAVNPGKLVLMVGGGLVEVKP